jgi:hypothetical protein
MDADVICTIVIRRAPGEAVEMVEIEIAAGEDLIVCRALDATRRRMLGYNPGPQDPKFAEPDQPI